MFSIAAINDAETIQDDWQPLAPTKEAQEFRLTQMYNESLLHLQGGEYKQAQMLLETIIQDPLSINSEMENVASSDPMRQLRFLAFRNLAEALFKQGSHLHKDALQCFLHAVSIDGKDVTIWNRLGTLACLLGSYNIARWAFEQGLKCSPQHWACMEKLVEVLIAIGDETACVYVARRLLKISPSHPRASLVRRVIEENFDPLEQDANEEYSDKYSRMLRGIDKLKPEHHSLCFSKKRKREESEISETMGLRNKAVLKLNLEEPSLIELINKILAAMKTISSTSDANEMSALDFDATKSIQKLSTEIIDCTIVNAAVTFTLDGKTIDKIEWQTLDDNLENQGNVISRDDSHSSKDLKVETFSDRLATMKERDVSTDEEPPLERRSTRLERIRTRKFDKSEEVDNIEDRKMKVSFEGLMSLLEPYIVCKDNLDDTIVELLPNSIKEEKAKAVDYVEGREVICFLREHMVNSGLFHISQNLIDKISLGSFKPVENWRNLISLEKCIRSMSRKHSIHSSLFLAEVYMDLASDLAGECEISEFVKDCDYHLCKILDFIAIKMTSGDTSGNILMPEGVGNIDKVAQDMETEIKMKSKVIGNCWWSFWVRYYWVSGRLHFIQGICEKGREDFHKCLQILESRKHEKTGIDVVMLPHCRMDNQISIEIVCCKIHEVRIQDLLSHQAAEMLEEKKYADLIELLVPILFKENTKLGSALSMAGKKRTTDFSAELEALEMLIVACEKSEPRNFDLALQCYIMRMQIHFFTVGILNMKGAKGSFLQGEANKEDRFKVIAKEVKHIGRWLAEFDQPVFDKTTMSPNVTLLGYMQQLLLTIMCHISMLRTSRRLSQAVTDALEQPEVACFVDAAVAFCRLQHFNPAITISQQVELLVRVHDVLAECGLCCAGTYCEGGEGVFLKMAIKHLLLLDMKLKMAMPDVVDDSISKINGGESVQLDINSISSDDGSNKGDEESIKERIAEGSKECHSYKKKKITPSELANDIDKMKEDLGMDLALDQSFFCLYGLNLRGGLDLAGSQDGLAAHTNTSLGEYQTKEQCAEVFHYLLPYARECTKTCLIKLRKVLRAIRHHFPGPPEDVLKNNAIDTFLDGSDIDEAKLSCMVLNHTDINEILEYVMKKPPPTSSVTLQGLPAIANVPEEKGTVKATEKYLSQVNDGRQQYKEVYENLYYLLAQVEETCASDKWPGFILTKEGEEFVDQNAKLFKYDLLYNVSRFESWQNLANLYDEEVDLLLNDASKTASAMGWHKNTDLLNRVEIGRRHTRRCLLMSLALAKAPEQESQVHEHLALVYYDALQNVAPSYNQRQHVVVRDSAWRDVCQKAFMHFKKALSFKSDWVYLFYLGKLCEKLGEPCEKGLAYYQKAAHMNPSSVDTLYRLHASRLKFLCSNGKDDIDIIKVIAKYSYGVGTNEQIVSLLQMGQSSENCGNIDSSSEGEKNNIKDAWNVLFDDCVKALEVCIEGELKHYHKARFRLAQGYFFRNRGNDKEKAKEELGFCFKSNRSLFTINMWEIDGSTKKNRRKTPGSSGMKRGFEVLMPEISRKFITCLRKYLLFYLHLCEKTFDFCTLERAFYSLRVDKKFSLCLADMINIALGKYIHALGTAISLYDRGGFIPNVPLHNLTERFFNLFMEHGGSWSDIVATSLNEAGVCSTDVVSENAIYRYIHDYLRFLEREIRVDVLESVNEKIKKKFKNLKMVKESCTQICKHAAIAWCRVLCISLSSITPTNLQKDGSTACSYDQLMVELKVDDMMNSASDNFPPKEADVVKYQNLLCMNGVRIKQTVPESMDQAMTLLRQTFTFYRDCAGPFPSGINLFLIPAGSMFINNVNAASTPISTTTSLVGVDLSVPRKLLLWAYTLVHGHTCNIAEAVKFCEEQSKNKVKKGLLPHVSSINFQERTCGNVTPKEASGIGAHQSNNDLVNDRETISVESHDRVGSSNHSVQPLTDSGLPPQIPAISVATEDLIQEDDKIPPTF